MAKVGITIGSRRPRKQVLGIYLNDHLAGATAGTELAHRVAKTHKDQGEDAALLVLLFAQPASRITRLTADDITADGTGTTFLHLGDPPVPVPEPFAALLRQAAAAPGDHPAAAISAAGRWLFPGQNAGRPIHPATLSHLLTEYGIPVPAARTAAFQALVRQAPAPVIARPSATPAPPPPITPQPPGISGAATPPATTPGNQQPVIAGPPAEITQHRDTRGCR